MSSPSLACRQVKVQHGEERKSTDVRRCEQCSTRKKRCDLTTPKCGRCSRIGLRCSFSSSAKQEDDLPLDIIEAIQFQGYRSANQLGFHFDDTSVVRLARLVRGNISNNIDPYLQGFNRWLPVVDGPQLKARSRNVETLQDEAFSGLLIVCTLLSRVSRPNPAHAVVEGNHELYMKLVASHAALLTRGLRSLEVLQSKVLLALYEHLQANHMAAVGTLGSAAAIAKTLGLFDWHCASEPEAISLVLEEQRVACCLYVLERIIHTVYRDDQPGPINLSCPRPCLNRVLCDEQGTIKLASIICKRCDSSQRRSDINFPEPPYPSLLSRLFQASVLLEMAMVCSADSLPAANTTGGRSALEESISKLALDIHEDRCRGAEVNCSVLGLCVSCILILPCQVEPTSSGLDMEHVAVALRMVFDRLCIVPAFQYKFSCVISPWELHCFYLAAKVHKRLSARLGHPVSGNADCAYGTIMSVLEDHNTGWKLAGELSRNI